MTEPRLSFWRAIGLVFSTAARHWRSCLAISLPYALLSGLTNAVMRTSTGIADPTTLDTSQVAAAGVEALLAMTAFVLVNIFVAPVTLGALSLVGSAAVYDDRVSTPGIIRRAFDRALDAVAAALLTALLIGVAMLVVAVLSVFVVVAFDESTGFALLLFGSIVVGIPVLYAFVRLSLAVPVVMREGRGPVEALKRSWALVKGGWWRTFGVGVVMALVVGTLDAVVSFRSFIGRDTAADFLGGAVLTAVAAAVTVILYGIASGVVYATRVPEDVRAAELDHQLSSDPQ